MAIWLATALGVVYVLLNDFQQLADKFILGIWPFYALAVGAVFVLRKRQPDLVRPYRTWGYPVVPLLFLLASIGMVLNALWTDPVNTGITFGIILAGVPVYFVWRADAAAGRSLTPSGRGVSFRAIAFPVSGPGRGPDQRRRLFDSRGAGSPLGLAPSSLQSRCPYAVMVSSGSDRGGRRRAVRARGRHTLRAGRHDGGGVGHREAGIRGRRWKGRS